MIVAIVVFVLFIELKMAYSDFHKSGSNVHTVQCECVKFQFVCFTIHT